MSFCILSCSCHFEVKLPLSFDFLCPALCWIGKTKNYSETTGKQRFLVQMYGIVTYDKHAKWMQTWFTETAALDENVFLLWPDLSKRVQAEAGKGNLF